MKEENSFSGSEMGELSLSAQITEVKEEETKESEISFPMQQSEERQLAEELFLKFTVPKALKLIGVLYKKFSMDEREIEINLPPDLLTNIEKISKALEPWMNENSLYRKDAVILQIGLLLSGSTLLIASKQDADIRLATSFLGQAQKYYSKILEENPILVDILSLCAMDEKYKIIHPYLPAWLDIYWEEYWNAVSDNESVQNVSPSRSRKKENMSGDYTRGDVIELLKDYQITLNHYLRSAAHTYENINRLYIALDDNKNAVKYLRKANNIYDQLDQAEECDSNNESVGNISPSRRRKEKDTFHSYTKEKVRILLEYYQEILNHYLGRVARTHEDISRLYQALENNKDMAKHLREAKNIYEKLNQKEDVDRIIKKSQKLQLASSLFYSRQAAPPPPADQARAINKKKCCCLIL
jgi:tetratricopeptide (TPR) repeat protein